jgi:hypothetical protein
VAKRRKLPVAVYVLLAWPSLERLAAKTSKNGRRLMAQHLVE